MCRLYSNFILLGFFAVLFAFTTKAQTYTSKEKKAIQQLEKGIEAYKSGNYNGAQQYYFKALEKDSEFAEAYFRLGQVLDITGQKQEAIKNYQKSITLQPNLNAISLAYHVLGNFHFQRGEYEKSIPLFEKYVGFNPKSGILTKRSKKTIENAKFAIEAIKNPLKITPVSLGKGVNVFHSQYFPSLTADKEILIFTGFNRNTQDENLYISQLKNKVWTYPNSISKSINTPENEGTAAISADGRTIVFTSCNAPTGFGSCDLYISYKKGDEWPKAINLGSNINTHEWESQPSLSADGRILYFVSDRRGGLGKKDIYVSRIDSAGEWGVAQNVGNEINTTEDEISPFIHPNGISLFFASDGYPGMGGMDIFFSENINKHWSKPQNFGYPINTVRDQVSLFITADNKKGYYSLEQNQDEESKNSLLYQFDLPQELSKKFKKANIVKGTVADAKSKKKIGADIEVYDLKNNNLESKLRSDDQTGEYMNVLRQGGSYGLFVNKPGYFFKSINFDYSDSNDSTAKYIDITLEPLEKNSKEILNNIYFDIAKFDLKPESKTELEKLLKLLNLNPNIAIEVSGHTDDKGKDADNILLSKNRAKSVYMYLIGNGIAPNRIKPEGYGKSKPSVPNNSDENRKLNRRIEIKII